MSLKLEVGKYYRTRDGRVVGPAQRGFDKEYPFKMGGITYTKYGRQFEVGGPSIHDIVAEMPTEIRLSERELERLVRIANEGWQALSTLYEKHQGQTEAYYTVGGEKATRAAEKWQFSDGKGNACLAFRIKSKPAPVFEVRTKLKKESK